MMRTEDLIDSLASDSAPVRPLAPPMRRASLWISAAVTLVVIVFMVEGPRPDLAVKMSQTPYLLEWIASLATGWASAIAAFHLSLPDRSRKWLLLPAIPAIFWFSSIGYGCFSDWVRMGPEGLALGTSWGCFRTILYVSLPLTVLQLVMLRHASKLRPIETLATGSLAAAAFSAAGLSLYHHLDTALMVLVWHLGSVAVVVGAWTFSARRAFACVEPDSPISR